MTQPPTPAGYESANSLDIPFPCQDHAEQEAAYLNKHMIAHTYATRQVGQAWYVIQTGWR
jgi:hypothetical protein